MRAMHSNHLNILALVTTIMSVEYTSCKVHNFVILPFIVTFSPLFTTLYSAPRSETSQILKGSLSIPGQCKWDLWWTQ